MIKRIFAFMFFFFVTLIFSNEDHICKNGECYPRIFIPTEEFQVIKEGQEIPQGTTFSQPAANCRSSR